MNPFKDTFLRENNGKIFTLHWKHRHDPVTMATIGFGVMAAGQVQQGIAANEEGKMQQKIMNQNALIKEREAAAALQRARVEADQFQREGKHLLAEQNVGYAKGGVLVSQGTPASLMEYTAQQLEEDRKTILREGFLAESFAKSEAENLRYEGKVYRAKGKNELTGRILQAGGTILTGYGNTR